MKLKINDKEYPLQWGMGAIEMWCDTLNLDLTDLDTMILAPGPDYIKQITTLIHCALKNGAEIESIHDDFEISYRRLQRILDEMPQEQYNAILEDFRNSKYLGRTISEMFQIEVAEETPTPPVKKKRQSRKSS